MRARLGFTCHRQGIIPRALPPLILPRWDDWIDQGEGYYPGFTRDPEPYYTRHGTWRGWAHFLGYSDMEIGVTEEHSDAD